MTADSHLETEEAVLRCCVSSHYCLAMFKGPQLARYSPSTPPNPHSHPQCTWSKARAAVNLASLLS